ncbi:NAD-dependent epimerase [Rubrolithibacter danxiaensis]|uniref:NAD-dependent epimerase n=1 Tax=Rubrolithibacter danxiaensis TaxID=3390805 RepID=UPI003BF8CFFD
MKILITGTAGFIGFYLAKKLLERGDEVVGIDNINDYYDVSIKYGRLAETGISKENIEYGEPVISDKYKNYTFYKLDLTDNIKLKKIINEGSFDAICNLAAQAGVRYSLVNPQAYIDSNIYGFLNLLEACRYNKIKHFVYASSSSVYGLNEKMPFSTHNNVDHPVSIYAATKKSNELMAHTYSHLFNLPTTGLRFFTVYGPWGRPDMAPILFTKAITEGRSIQVFNNGNMKRDFTYIDDIVEGIVRVIDNPAHSNPDWSGMDPDPATSNVPYRIFNIGKGSPVNLMEFIEEIENNLGKKAEKDYLPMQDGDVTATWADITDLENILGYKPRVSVQEGVKRFISWYKYFYQVQEAETVVI